jgi:hypothetical protein
MDAHPLVCPKCNGSMTCGFIADFTYGHIEVSSWVEGPPERSFWTGTKVPKEKRIPIGTFRCTACGYLESYARPEFAVGTADAT